MISPLASPMRGWRNTTPFRGRGRGVGQFVPQQLGLTALYDANNGGSASQITDSGGGSLAALAFAASTASPTFLAAPGSEPYVQLPGVAANYVSSPSVAALQITGRLTLIAYAKASDWTPASQVYFGGRWNGAATARSYQMSIVATSGLIQVGWGDGVSAMSLNSSVAPTITDGSGLWVAVDLQPDNGASGRTAKFYTSTDSPQTALGSIAWTQLGTDVTAATASSILAGSQNLEIGSAFAGATVSSIVMERFGIISGSLAAGTIVADFNAALAAQTGYTDAYGRVYTVNYGTSGLASVVKSSAANDTAAGVLTDGSNDYATGPAGAIPPLGAAAACTLFCVARPRATMTANMTFFSTRNGTGAGVTLRMASATTVVADISDGTTTVTTPAVTIVPGTRYVLGVVIPASGGAYCFANNTLGPTQARTGNTETGGALTVFATSTPANFCRTHSRVPYGAAPSDIGAGGIANLVAYYGGGV